MRKTTCLDPELQRRVEAYVKAAHTSPGEVLRKAFDEYEAAHRGVQGNGAAESAFEAFARTGLIGCIKSGPADLSTNRRRSRLRLL